VAHKHNRCSALQRESDCPEQELTAHGSLRNWPISATNFSPIASVTQVTEYVLPQAACIRSTPGNIIPVAKLPGGVFGSCAGWSAAAWRPQSSASVEGRFGVAVHHVLSCVPLLSSCKLYSSHGFLALTTFLTRCYLPLQSVFLIPCN
jgi:hypothetical protein